MNLTTKGLVGTFAALLVFVFPPLSRGDDYTRGADGDFSNMEWGRLFQWHLLPAAAGAAGLRRHSGSE